MNNENLNIYVSNEASVDGSIEKQECPDFIISKSNMSISLYKINCYLGNSLKNKLILYPKFSMLFDNLSL